MSNIERNKSVALRWMESAVAGDGETVRALFSPDCRIFISGDMPFCGWMNLEDFFGQTGVLDFATPITFDLGRMVAEGDEVWFEASGDATLANGNSYTNNYIFQMTIIDGTIVRYAEITDTLHQYRVGDSERVRGAPIPRQRLVEKVEHRFCGAGV